MTRKRQKYVGITVDAAIPFGQQIIEGVYRYSQEHELWRFHLVEAMPYLPASEIPHWKGDGIIGLASQSWVPSCRRRGIPFVNVSTLKRLPKSSVVVDNYAIGSMAAEHLLSKGLHNFGIVYRNDLDRWGVRIAGFVDTIRKAGFQPAIVTVGSSCPTNSAATSDIMSSGPAQLHRLSRPVGLFATHDGLARETIECCLEIGLRVPEDVAVIGEGNRLFICESILPRMSSVESGSERLGYRAAELLDKLMKGGKPPDKPILMPPVRVIERESTDIRAVGAPIVAEAIQFIRANMARPILVSDILDELSVSRRTLERRFRRELGRTVFEEIRRAKIRYACDLLIDTGLAVGQICRACGYANRARFNVAFNAETDMTPTEYRRLCKEGV